tara:strand:+ start:966 stop:2039 length:1074 start_codon:yes stop_codon:yes gene_type:complete
MNRSSHTARSKFGLLVAASLLPTLAHAQADTEWASWALEPMPSETLVEPEGGPEFFGFLRIYDETSHGPGFVAGADPELQALRILQIRMGLRGQVAGTNYFITTEGATGAITLVDAFARTEITDDLGVTIGRFRAPFSFNGLLPASVLLMTRRSRQSLVWAGRDTGVMLDHSVGDRTHVFVAAQNGGDGTSDEHMLTARVEHQIAGQHRPQVGALCLDAETDILLGVAIADEGSVSGGQAFAADVTATWQRWYAQAEVVGYGDGYTPGGVMGGIGARANGQGGTTPWALASAFAIDEELEAVARYEDQDLLDTWVGTVGVNWRPQPGVRWGLHIGHQEGAGASLEGDRLDLGVTLSF